MRFEGVSMRYGDGPEVLSGLRAVLDAEAELRARGARAKEATADEGTAP